MREILFRGKRVYNGEWVEGFLFNYNGALCIQTEGIGCDDYGLYPRCYAEVIPESISEFTNLTDKNGKKIFEGDILEFSDRLVIVFWHTHLGCWDSNFLKFTNKDNRRDDMSPLNWEYKSNVVGNIHDDSELLKGEINEAD